MKSLLCAPPLKPLKTPDPSYMAHARVPKQLCACAPQHYRLEHVHYELDSEAPMTASKSIGKAIKKGMRYVNYKHKETGSLKEIEHGLNVQKIRLRLKGTNQAGKRKVTIHDYRP